MSKRWLCIPTLFLGGVLALPAAAQQTAVPADQPAATPAAAPAAAPAATPAAQPQDASAPAAAPAAPTWSAGPIDFSGTIDGYYGFNFNHPIALSGSGGSNAGQVNYLYNFNTPANQFSLNMVKLGMSHSADPVGFEFDLMYGNTDAAIPSSPGFDQYVENAYVTFKPMKAKGFEMDFGKFVTTAGAEVIESYSNWNYSRSLLFAWAIPYYHFGLRTSWPMGKHWTGGFQLVNGWNNTLDNNSGKTVGLNLAAAYAKWGWVIDWYGGPENTGTNQGWRNLYDTTLTLTPSSKVSAYINYDYGINHIYNGSFPDNTLVKYQGAAVAMKIQATSKWAFTPRVEFFDDPDGFAMQGASVFSDHDPVAQQVKEITLTGEYKFLEGLMWRGEYRYDWSNKPFFLVGAECSSPPLCADRKKTSVRSYRRQRQKALLLCMRSLPVDVNKLSVVVSSARTAGKTGRVDKKLFDVPSVVR